MEFVSVARAADRLGLARRTVSTTLAATGLGRESRSTIDDVYPIFDSDSFDELATRPFIEPCAPRALVVKLGAPRPDFDGRKMGYSVDYTPDELRDAFRMYWRVAHAEEWIGHPLIAVVCGFVVATTEITNVERHHGGLVEFDVKAAAKAVAKAYDKHRIKTRPGGVIEYVGSA